jgi:hypothetical protein
MKIYQNKLNVDLFLFIHFDYKNQLCFNLFHSNWFYFNLTRAIRLL